MRFRDYPPCAAKFHDAVPFFVLEGEVFTSHVARAIGRRKLRSLECCDAGFPVPILCARARPLPGPVSSKSADSQSNNAAAAGPRSKADYNWFTWRP